MRTKDFTRYLHYLKGHYATLLLALVCALIFGASSGLGIPVIVKEVLPIIFTPPEGVSYTMWQIAGIAALIPAIFIVRGVFGFLSAYLIGFCASDMLRRMKNDIFAKVQEYPLAFFDEHTTGDLYVRLSNDTTVIQNVVLKSISECLREPVQMMGAAGFLGYTIYNIGNPMFLLVLVVFAPLMIMPVQLMRRRLKRYARENQVSLGEISQRFSENLDAAHEVRVFNLQQREIGRFNAQNSHYRKILLKLIKYEQTQQPLMEIVTALMIGAVFFYAYSSKISFPTFAAVGIALYFLFDPLKRFMRVMSDFYKTTPLFHRINEILDYESPVPEPENPAEVGRLTGNVRFDGVDFAYNEKIVLKDATIDIPAGTSCALVGESGAGKSTFAKLVMRFYDPVAGRVSIDGIDLRDMRTFDLRKNLGSVPQYPVLFNDTIFNNIAMAKEDATPEEVYEAARRAYAHELIGQLENGYDTMVGERGDRLSGGQKQRIALARVFLKDAPILILDEATSALDSNSETFIQKALDELMGSRTCFIIAHRFSTIRNVKKIIVFEKGKIIDFGAHDELMGHCPYYKGLYTRQALTAQAENAVNA